MVQVVETRQFWSPNQPKQAKKQDKQQPGRIGIDIGHTVSSTRDLSLYTF